MDSVRWAVAALLVFAGCASVANEVDAQEIGVDASVRPGDDFFGYANGAWLRDTEIPAASARWNTRNELVERAHQRVVRLVADAATAPLGSGARKVADFHTAYLDQATIEAKGNAPLKPELDRIDRVRDKDALTRLLGHELRADVDPLGAGVHHSSHVLGLAVGSGIHAEKTNVAFLLQGGLGLPNREDYIGADAQAPRTGYEATIGRMLERAGFDHGTERARGVMVLETALAQSHATEDESSSDRNADHVWTRADFMREAPGMDWSAFFAAAGLARQQTFVAWQPSAMKGLAAALASRPLDAWKDYLRFHVLLRHADVLPRVFDASGEDAAAKTREQRALDATQAALRDAVGRMYVERWFPATQKARVQTIAANVIAVFRKRVERATWMSPATKAMALNKLHTVYLGVGYPDRWPSDADLVVDPTDAVGNRRRVVDRDYRLALHRLGKPVDRTAWAIPSQRFGAVILFHQNAYNFAAALLEPPKFDAAASDATNYGAIGAIVGHEIGHLVDSLGAEYEADGRMRRWWTPDDTARYDIATHALVKQYTAYQALPDLAVDGKRTLVENLADLGGLAAAFDAYRHAAGASDRETLRRQDREFFISFARSWRGKSRDASIRTQVATDSHAPERDRVATVRNLDAWYDAFDVRPGDRLYLAPEDRVRIW